MSAAKRSGLSKESSASVLAKYPPEITENYIIRDTIGAGGFAKVKLARHKITDEKVAIKVMDKEALRKTNDLQRVALEIQALRELRHQNIAKLYEVVETNEKYFLVLEYAPGGELFDYIVARDRLKEPEARVFFRQIVAAVAYCHSRGYVHRDLKPENLLLDSSQNIKLIDFGLIAHPANVNETRLTTCCGSAAYAAPELIRGEPYLGPAADIWSLGILLYALLCGFLPFDDENTQRLYRLIQRGQYEVPQWLSQDSQKLIAALLRHKPEQRITMEQLLRHPWMLIGSDLDSVHWKSDCEGDVLDMSVASELSKHIGVDIPTITARIYERKFDRLTALYELMAVRRAKGRPIKLPGAARQQALGSKSLLMVATHNAASHSGSAPAITGGSLTNLDAVGQSTPAGEEGSELTPLSDRQRWASQYGLDPESSAVRSPRPRRTSSHPDLTSPTKTETFTFPPVEEPAKSVVVEEPKAEPMPRRTFGGSIRNLARSIQSIFGSRNLDEPRQVRGLYDMSTTSTKSPLEVKEEVLRVLRATPKLQYKERGFVLRVRLFDDAGKEIVGMSIEVVRVPMMDLTAIKLTRLKGDTWDFKKARQELISQMRF